MADASAMGTVAKLSGYRVECVRCDLPYIIKRRVHSNLCALAQSPQALPPTRRDRHCRLCAPWLSRTLQHTHIAHRKITPLWIHISKSSVPATAPHHGHRRSGATAETSGTTTSPGPGPGPARSTELTCRGSFPRSALGPAAALQQEHTHELDEARQQHEGA